MAYTVDTTELKKAMINAGINTTVELSERSGVNRNTVGGILNGEIRPSSAVIEKIARALSLDGQDIGRIFFKAQLA
ncbi:MAG: helix-turn-helix transcriptional regulator [Mogibacterium sp.]|nr:helix-turn-helix transcriptional regulator [Mogibacterium sp.]